MKSLYLYIIQTILKLIIKPKGIVDCDDSYLLKKKYIGSDVKILSWPGKGCFIGTHSQEPNNVTYFEKEIQMASVATIIEYCNFATIVCLYTEQQLN